MRKEEPIRGTRELIGRRVARDILHFTPKRAHQIPRQGRKIGVDIPAPVVRLSLFGPTATPQDHARAHT